MANAVFNSPKTPKAASPGGPVTKPVSHRITTSVKKFKDAVNGVTGGHNGRAPKPGADSTSKKDNADSTSKKDNADSTSKKDNADSTSKKDNADSTSKKDNADSTSKKDK